MSYEIRKITLSDATSGLLDVASEPDIASIEVGSVHRFGVAQHFVAVGQYMRSAMEGLDREQKEQEAGDSE